MSILAAGTIELEKLIEFQNPYLFGKKFTMEDLNLTDN